MAVPVRSKRIAIGRSTPSFPLCPELLMAVTIITLPVPAQCRLVFYLGTWWFYLENVRFLLLKTYKDIHMLFANYLSSTNCYNY
jgi:hypothetical protein